MPPKPVSLVAVNGERAEKKKKPPPKPKKYPARAKYKTANFSILCCSSNILFETKTDQIGSGQMKRRSP